MLVKLIMKISLKKKKGKKIMIMKIIKAMKKMKKVRVMTREIRVKTVK